MRICVVSYHSSPLDPVGSGKAGGMNVCVFNIYKRLSLFCEIDIFICGEREDADLGDSVRVLYLDCENPYDFADTVIEYHKRRKYDLIHTHYWLSGLIGLITRKKLNIPWVHSLHTVEILKDFKQDRMRINVEDEIIRSCDFIISPTDKEANEIGRMYQDTRIITIPNGVDTRRFTPSHNGHSKLLYIGRIDPIKGLDILVDAMSHIKRDIQLDIIGGTSKGEHNLKNIKRYAKGLPINFLGKIRHEDINLHYQHAGIIIIPSYYESFGLVGLEAMASARPVIGFNNTGLSETVEEDAGILVRRGAKNLAKAIRFLIDDKNLRYKLGKTGRKKAYAFEWGNIALRYYRNYYEIIKS